MTATHHTIARPDAQLHVCVHGDPAAPAVYLAHSILASQVMWEGQIRRLCEAGYRVIAADTRGHGESQTLSDTATMQTLVEDILATLDALRVERVHYVGLSLGGMAGFGLAARHADRLVSLCLCDARADAPPDVAAPWDERIAIAQREGCKALAGPTLVRWFGQPFLDADARRSAQLADMIARTSVTGFVACARAIQSLDALDDIARISTPTRMIVGANDGVLPSVMQRLADGIEGAQLVVIPAAGHLPNIDQPAAFNAALLEHLARAG